MNHVFKQTIDALVDSKLLNSEDIERILEVVNVLTKEVIDIDEELKNHPKHQLTVSHYANWFKYQKQLVNIDLEGAWYSMHRHLSTALDKKPTEAQVTAALMSDPTYIALLRKEKHLGYFSDQLEGLRASYMVRARCIEQLSNNSRAALRDETEE